MDPSNAMIPSHTASSIVKRSNNYSDNEEVAIIREYIYVSTDPINGSEQQEFTYYMHTWEAYKKKNPADAGTRPVLYRPLGRGSRNLEGLRAIFGVLHDHQVHDKEQPLRGR